MQIGPYVALEISRTAGGNPIRVRVRQALADELGWSAAFPTETQAELDWSEMQGRRSLRLKPRRPHRGGAEAAIYLAENPRAGSNYRRFRFRVTGPWTHSALAILREATIPEVHAITAGRVAWRRTMAQNAQP